MLFSTPLIKNYLEGCLRDSQMQVLAFSIATEPLPAYLQLSQVTYKLWLPLRLSTALWPSCLYPCWKLRCPWCPRLNISRSDDQAGNFHLSHMCLSSSSCHCAWDLPGFHSTRETGCCHFPSFTAGKLRHDKPHYWGLYGKFFFKSHGSRAEDSTWTSSKSHFSRNLNIFPSSEAGDLISNCFSLSKLGQISFVCLVYKMYFQADVMIE